MPKGVNNDAKRVHIRGENEIPTPIFGCTRSYKPGEPRSSRTENNTEDTGQTQSMEQERITTIREANVDDNNVTRSTIPKSTVHGSDEAIVFDNTILEDI